MSTDFSPKNGMCSLNSTEGPDFATWSQENLEKFAAEAYSKMCDQAEEMMRLQQDLKTAIEAYRVLLRR